MEVGNLYKIMCADGGISFDIGLMLPSTSRYHQRITMLVDGKIKTYKKHYFNFVELSCKGGGGK